MALLTPGYFPTTYWAEDYWDPNYWTIYGTAGPSPTVCRTTTILTETRTTTILAESRTTTIVGCA